MIASSMQAEGRLEGGCLELQQEIFRYFGRLSEVEEVHKRRAADSAARVKGLEAQLRQAEEREGQLNSEWAPLEAARDHSLRIIYENLIAHNALSQKLEKQLTNPAHHDDTSPQGVAQTYDRIFYEQRQTSSKP